MTVPARKPLIAGNWKLYKTAAEATALVRDIAARLPEVPTAEIALAPVFTCLPAVATALAGTAMHLAAQNVYPQDQGAFTGEVGPLQLRELGCRYVIVGHSERRQIFGETDELIGHKARAVLAHGMSPIVCVGETLAEREAGHAEAVVVRQLTGALAKLVDADLARVVVAYEPVWAIGTGRNAQPADAQQMHARIRGELGKRAPEVAAGLRILYGGSVKPDNAAALLREPDLDGALVGGASLAADSFCAIVAAAAG